MRLFQCVKDGGKESTVWAYFLIEWKSLFSVALLHFHRGSRDAYHNHAFNCVSWLFRGELTEVMLNGTIVIHKPSIWPIITRKDTFHKVVSHGHSWALTIRGPWENAWKEWLPGDRRYVNLTHGRETA